ncbi:unnamed protein product, partial [marine sediment metagenome]
LGTVGFAIVVILFFSGIFADFLAPYGMNEFTLADRLTPPGSAKYILGTDTLGRDMLSRIIFGARISMIVGLAGSALCIIVASLIGLVTGFFGGVFDMVTQRFVDAWMSFPSLFIALAVMSILGPGLGAVILVLGLFDGIRNSRVIRSAVIGIKENVYIQASVAIGASTPRILIRHVLPNVMAPIMVVFTMSVGRMILAEATLSFLGFGIPPPEPSWGGMLSGIARTYLLEAPWLALWSGLALAIVVFGVNMFGDAVR